MGFELEAGETVLDTWTAGIPNKKGTRNNYGGTLTVTDRRVIWEVLKVSAKRVFAIGAGGLYSRAAIAVAAAGRSVVGAMLGDRRGVSIPLDEIVSVEADPDRHAVLLIGTADGEVRLLVTNSKWAYNKKADRVARDAAVAAIQSAWSDRT